MKKIKLFLKIGFVLIFALFILAFSASDRINPVTEDTKQNSLNESSSLGVSASRVENMTPTPEESLNSSKNESAGPVAITLEKPSFID